MERFLMSVIGMWYQSWLWDSHFNHPGICTSPFPLETKRPTFLNCCEHRLGRVSDCSVSSTFTRIPICRLSHCIGNMVFSSFYCKPFEVTYLDDVDKGLASPSFGNVVAATMMSYCTQTGHLPPPECIRMYLVILCCLCVIRYWSGTRQCNYHSPWKFAPTDHKMSMYHALIWPHYLCNPFADQGRLGSTDRVLLPC